MVELGFWQQQILTQSNCLKSFNTFILISLQIFTNTFFVLMFTYNMADRKIIFDFQAIWQKKIFKFRAWTIIIFPKFTVHLTYDWFTSLCLKYFKECSAKCYCLSTFNTYINLYREMSEISLSGAVETKHVPKSGKSPWHPISNSPQYKI